jgi:hypothetical protein
VNFTIREFWLRKLSFDRAALVNNQPGWNQNLDALEVFVEAPLGIDAEFGGDNINDSPIILVSAPGAVGKSTLARQISALSGAVYIDLAASSPVGGNFLSGGLAKSGLFDTWRRGRTTALIDGLDEGRLRVTQAAFSSFLEDVVHVSGGRNVPTVLFGRTGSIQEAWLMLLEHGVTAPVLEIGYYPAEKAIEFALARVRKERRARDHEIPERKAITLLLERLRASTERDGDRFSGYAPVLMAVADRVSQEANPIALVSEIESGGRPVTLESVVDSILSRENGKLGTLQFSSSAVRGGLYLPTEQLDRLCARVYGSAAPPLPPLPPQDAQIYGHALDTWVPEHPFLDGLSRPTSVVFAARIAAHALHSAEYEDVARKTELAKGIAANPFLADFYLSSQNDGTKRVRPEHIGLLYSSIRATLSLGDGASLQVEQNDEDVDDERSLAVLVEVTVDRKEADKADILELKSEQIGTMQLGLYVEDVDINLPLAQVQVGLGGEATFVAPVNIQCESLAIDAERVIVETGKDNAANHVHLECGAFSGPKVSTVPTIRGGATLSVTWPSSSAHPWTSFSISAVSGADPRVDEGLRRLRKFVIAFRSHSKGSLRRYRAKLDHARMTKGTGQAILDALIDEKIITISGAMYELNADLLGETTGTTYAESMRRSFSARTIDFVKKVLRGD